jgi:hypothetical protein
MDWALSSSTDTTLVGSYPSGAIPYGVLEMVGDGWEYVDDWYGGDYYANSPPSNPQGPESGGSRVMRGGAWDGHSYHLRSAYRFNISPDSTGNYIGFRCARSEAHLLSSTDSITTITPMPTALPLPTLTPPPTSNPQPRLCQCIWPGFMAVTACRRFSNQADRSVPALLGDG